MSCSSCSSCFLILLQRDCFICTSCILTLLLSLSHMQQVVNEGGDITNIHPAVIVQVSIGIILAITA